MSHTPQQHQDDQLDSVLRQDLLQPPPQFTWQVMQHIHELPLPFASPLPKRQRWEWLQWLALLGGALFSMEQLASYAFGIWLVTSIG